MSFVADNFLPCKQFLTERDGARSNIHNIGGLNPDQELKAYDFKPSQEFNILQTLYIY